MAKKSVSQFFAITETASVVERKTVRQRTQSFLSIDNQLAVELASTFERMADSFFEQNPTIVPFDGRYQPCRGELFVIEDFALDVSLQKALKNTLAVPPLNLTSSPFPQIKALIHAKAGESPAIIFQVFNTDQIIRQGWALQFLHQSNTFKMVDASGLAIGSDVDAVYKDSKLYFRSYYTANRFLDLTAYFKEATDEDIKELLKMDGIIAEDEESLLRQADSVMRRRFEIIRKTEILSLFTPEQIAVAAGEQGLSIDFNMVDGEKTIVIPSLKSEAKELLDFLCQARFVGSLTKEVFVANSYRPISKKTQVNSNQANAESSAKAMKKKTAKKAAGKKAATKK